MISLSLVIVSCSGGGKEKIHDSDTTVLEPVAVRDTIPEPQDSVRVYYSDDLRAFGIKGDVVERSAVRHGADIVYPEPTMELTFDSIGNFDGSLKGLYAKRGEDGLNYSYSMNYEDGTSWELTYTELNDQSYPLKAEILESGPQGIAKVTLNYYGYEYDREKNWVMRSVTMERHFTETDTEEKTSSFRKWKELVSYKYRDKKEE
ncbi:MAG: hypothetical protein K2J70_04860 [Muribaculaceae bacterium]|nr:hypothetical protein [Muribaculaceae bacterium]